MEWELSSFKFGALAARLVVWGTPTPQMFNRRGLEKERNTVNAIDHFLLDTTSLFSKITRCGWNLYEGCKEAGNDVIGHPVLAYSLRHPDRIFMPMPMRHIPNMP